MDEYLSRINRVLDYIESHLEEPLTLEELAAVACFSRFHFHRLFAAMVGETLNQFIQRVRLEKAARLLLVNPKDSVTEIALGCGFAGSATFARAFREAFGMSATRWRAVGPARYRNLSNEESNLRMASRKIGKDRTPLSRYLRGASRDEAARDDDEEREGRPPMPETKAVQVKVEELPPIPVAYVRHIGPYKGDERLFEGLFERLMRWAGPRGLLRFPKTKVLVIYHDTPEITKEDKLRISACITVPEGTPAEGEVGTMVVSGGKYALARFEIGPDEYQAAWDYLFCRWLPKSGYQPDDRPCFELYHNNADEHPQKKRIVDICVPVRPL